MVFMDIVQQENQVRGVIFLISLFFFWGLGILFPFRKILPKKDIFRWLNNLSLIFLNSFLMKLLVPISLVSLSTYLQSKNYGFFNLIDLPFILQASLSILLLDCVVYWQHLIFHKFPPLWKLHRLHHTDINYDTTTALRFHPIEILISLFIKAFFILLLGLDPFSIIVFEVILNFSAMFNHSNFSLPKKVDAIIRLIIVTPDMHRVHHSTIPSEHHSNFGFFLSIWDQIFKTYVKQTKENSKTMNFGLISFRTLKDQRLDQLLIQPFKKIKK